jgi:enoyl-CoA hydratase/carnithine racemase
MSDELVRERRGHVLVARRNRPEVRNALDATLIRSIGEAMNEAEVDPEIRAVVLTGTGDRAFDAGVDLRAFASGAASTDDDPEATDDAAGAAERLRELQPVVFRREDAKEGATAFVEERPSIWRGR